MRRDRRAATGRRRVLRATGSVLAAMVAAGCTGSDDESEPSPATVSTGETTTDQPTESTATHTTSETATISILDASFSPRHLRVDPGTEVTWRNDGSGFHAIQSDVLTDAGSEWSFYSADMPTGRSVSYTFADPGAHEYYCSSHGAAEMCGVVLVGDVDYDRRPPCEQD